MNRGSLWKHKKHGKVLFLGTYDWKRGVDRSFVLVAQAGSKKISFESHEAAKDAGWVKAA